MLWWPSRGASDSSVKNGLLGHLSKGTKLCSLSLALVKRGWVAQANRGRSVTERKHTFSMLENLAKNLSALTMLNGDQEETSESLRGRKLLHNTSSTASECQMVVLNPNGSGNFSTINAAVAATPNNTGTQNGYFVIYVTAGIYEEYVSIASNKKNLMMIGDGINRNIITGNRSVADGWTTYSSPTFGKLINWNFRFYFFDGPKTQQFICSCGRKRICRDEHYLPQHSRSN